MTHSLTFDKSVLDGLRQRDNTALAVVVDQMRNPLTRFVRKLLHYQDDALADDIVQESFIALHRSPNVQSADKIHSYLFRIAANKVTDHWRRASRQRRLVRQAGQRQSLARGEDDMTQKTLVRLAVEQSLSELPAKYRLPLLLVEYEHYAYQEIAELLGLSLANVKTRVFRAREKMITLLKQREVTYE